MKKIILTMKAVTAGVLSAVLLCGAAAGGASAATVCESVAGNDTAIIHLNRVKEYEDSTTDAPEDLGTVTAHVNDVLEVTLYGQTTDPAYPRFCNTQQAVYFMQNSNRPVEWEPFTTGDKNGLLECYERWYAPVRSGAIASIEPFLGANVLTSFSGAESNPTRMTDCYTYTATNAQNVIDLTEKTKIASFTLKVRRGGEGTITLMDQIASSIGTEKLFVNDKARFTIEAQVVGKADLRYTWGDLDGDDKVTINDVTALQRHLADLQAFDAYQLCRGNVNHNKCIDIDDATKLQRYLAELLPTPAFADFSV